MKTIEGQLERVQDKVLALIAARTKDKDAYQRLISVYEKVLEENKQLKATVAAKDMELEQMQNLTKKHSNLQTEQIEELKQQLHQFMDQVDAQLDKWL